MKSKDYLDRLRTVWQELEVLSGYFKAAGCEVLAKNAEQAAKKVKLLSQAIGESTSLDVQMDLIFAEKPKAAAE